MRVSIQLDNRDSQPNPTTPTATTTNTTTATIRGTTTASGDRTTSSTDHLVYTSTDWLKGNILLALQRADAVSRITMTLQGKLVSSVVAAASNPLDGTLHAVDNHKLFRLSQIIFPQHDVPIPSKGFSLPKGNTSIPFKLRFPVLAACPVLPQDPIRHLQTSLPPTFKFTSPSNDGCAMVEYHLKVEVSRPQRFKSDLSERREIKFIPLDPALPPPMLEPTRNKSTRALRYEVLKSPSTSSGTGFVVLDTRQVTLAATLPAPAILRIGSGLQLGVFLIAQDGLTTTPPLFLRTFTLNLLTETTINLGPNLKTWTSTKEITSDFNLEVEIKPDQQEFVPKELLDDARVPEGPTPSFTTCTFKQEHFVVVAVGLSYEKYGQILNMKTMINVELHSGIARHPHRDALLTPEEEESEEQFTFVPWRIGSDRHLGILGRRDSRTDNAPPPPY